ncbi:hypothetical protein FS749_002387 [Ceratobasidium sp. UAMH 11750]|nr:hypothetical protein FS749_002387 [Ceratobasidium sp. UAMH 11750]
MAAVLSPLQQLSLRTAPSFNRSARPENFPLMLSLGMGTVGCYLGLEALNKHTPPIAVEQERQPWSWKNYRLGLTEKTVDEVFFTIGV